MATLARNDQVKLRLTSLEKESWAEAAGGKGRISEWVRAVCNAAAATGHTPSTTFTSRVTTSRKPATVSHLNENQVLVTKPLRETEDCPRWMHHRPGSYCGTCKQVTK